LNIDFDFLWQIVKKDAHELVALVESIAGSESLWLVGSPMIA
jgi:hypothetical protein